MWVRPPTPGIISRNGPGIASIFGMTTRAMHSKPGPGLHAWATPTSQATLMKMNASSIVMLHSSTSMRAASSQASCMASMNSNDVPWTIHRSASSVTGQRPCLPFTRPKRTTTSPAISTPVPQISPSPIEACMSPTANIPPGWRTGK